MKQVSSNKMTCRYFRVVRGGNNLSSGPVDVARLSAIKQVILAEGYGFQDEVG